MILKIDGGKLELCRNDGSNVRTIASTGVIDAELNNDETLIVVTYDNGKVEVRKKNGSHVRTIISSKATKAKWQEDDIAITLENGEIELRNDMKNYKNHSHQINWHDVSRKGILISKFLILLFLLCTAATLTYKYLDTPYSIFLIGIEIAIFFMSCFIIIRMTTFKPMEPVTLPEHLSTVDEQTKLLWTNITYDINKYEEGSLYYFNSVKIYKYSTIILAGISTIILGLDLKGVKIGLMDYTILAKNTALIIGAIITISTSLFTYWNIEKYWLINKTIVNKLRALRDEIEDALSSNSLDKDTMQKKVERYKEIKEDFNKYWEGALSERSSQSGQQK